MVARNTSLTINCTEQYRLAVNAGFVCVAHVVLLYSFTTTNTTTRTTSIALS